MKRGKPGWTVMILLLVLGASDAQAQGLKFRQDSPALLQERLKVTPATPEERLAALRAMFAKAGCAEKQIVEQPVPDGAPNLICTLPGKQPGTLVFSAAYDFASKKDEAQVQWGTVALLPAMAESLKDSPRRYSLVLIAMGGHNKGDAGAKEYLSKLSENDRKSILAMIDMDRLGRTPLAYHFPDHEVLTKLQRGYGGNATVPMNEPGHVDTVLVRALGFAADRLQVDRPAELRETPRTDATIFQKAKIQSLGLQSPAYTILIRPGNTEIKQIRSTVDFKSYEQTYQLLCVYALVLDQGLQPPKL